MRLTGAFYSVTNSFFSTYTIRFRYSMVSELSFVLVEQAFPLSNKNEPSSVSIGRKRLKLCEMIEGIFKTSRWHF